MALDGTQYDHQTIEPGWLNLPLEVPGVDRLFDDWVPYWWVDILVACESLYMAASSALRVLEVTPSKSPSTSQVTLKFPTPLHVTASKPWFFYAPFSDSRPLSSKYGTVMCTHRFSMAAVKRWSHACPASKLKPFPRETANLGGEGTLPSGKHTKSYWKWPFIVDFPMKNGGSFHSYVNVYRRVPQKTDIVNSTI